MDGQMDGWMDGYRRARESKWKKKWLKDKCFPFYLKTSNYINSPQRTFSPFHSHSLQAVESPQGFCTLSYRSSKHGAAHWTSPWLSPGHAQTPQLLSWFLVSGARKSRAIMGMIMTCINWPDTTSWEVQSPSYPGFSLRKLLFREFFFFFFFSSFSLCLSAFSNHSTMDTDNLSNKNV